MTTASNNIRTSAALAAAQDAIENAAIRARLLARAHLQPHSDRHTGETFTGLHADSYTDGTHIVSANSPTNAALALLSIHRSAETEFVHVESHGWVSWWDSDVYSATLICGPAFQGTGSGVGFYAGPRKRVDFAVSRVDGRPLRSNS